MHSDTPSDGGLHPAGGQRGDLARTVAADLENIFRTPPPLAPGASRARAIRPGGLSGARGSPARIGGVVAAALAGLALGVVLVDGAAPDHAPSKPEVRAQFAAATVVPPVAVQVQQPAAAAAVAPPPPRAQPAEPPVRAEAVVRKASHKPKPKRATKVKTEAASLPGRCERLSGGARARCSYPAVLAADRRLRRAYAQATRAGVSNRELASYRNRWARLRHRADDQPGRVIRDYGDMARDLNRLAQSSRS